MLSMLLLLGMTDMTAQTFKLSGDLRGMLTEDVAEPLALTGPQAIHIPTDKFHTRYLFLVAKIRNNS